jgi:hypothetical protein
VLKSGFTSEWLTLMSADKSLDAAEAQAAATLTWDSRVA